MQRRREAQHRLSVIQPALRCLPGRDRSKAIREIAKQDHIDELGHRRRYRRATLYRWINAYETHGLCGLETRRRADRKSKRVTISELFDRDSGFAAEKLAEIDSALTLCIKSRYAGELKPSRRLIAWDASRKLAEWARAAGFGGTDDELKRICSVPEHYVRRHRHFNVLAIKRKDAKQHADNQVIRVIRTRGALPPMAFVSGDWKHHDVLLHREDGSEVTAKLVCFLDLGTNRVFYDVEIPPPGRAVRQEHVIRAFIKMTRDQEWGMPALVQLDHGGEYKKLDRIEDALRLAGGIHADNVRRLYSADQPELAEFVAGELEKIERAIRRARPYNAAAKPIEGIFGVLELWVFSRLPGWIGGDRMRKKTQMVGREPEAFPGTAAQFMAALKIAFDYYHALPQRGSLKGKSPREAFAAAVAAGWQRVDVSADALHEVFSDVVPCTVRQGSVKIRGLDGRHWAPEIASYPAGTRLTAFVPIAGDRKRIAVRDGHDEFVCFVEPVPQFHILDHSGAGWSGKAIKAQNEVLSRMLAETAPLDPIADMREATAALPQTPAAASGGHIFVDSKAVEVARKRRALPAPAASKLAVNPEVERWRRLSPSYVEIETAGGTGPPAAAPETAISGAKHRRRNT